MYDVIIFPFGKKMTTCDVKEAASFIYAYVAGSYTTEQQVCEHLQQATEQGILSLTISNGTGIEANCLIDDSEHEYHGVVYSVSPFGDKPIAIARCFDVTAACDSIYGLLVRHGMGRAENFDITLNRIIEFFNAQVDERNKTIKFKLHNGFIVYCELSYDDAQNCVDCINIYAFWEASSPHGLMEAAFAVYDRCQFYKAQWTSNELPTVAKVKEQLEQVVKSGQSTTLHYEDENSGVGVYLYVDVMDNLSATSNYGYLRI